MHVAHTLFPTCVVYGVCENAFRRRHSFQEPLQQKLSKTLYTIYHDVKGAEKETEEIASSVSILSTVLEALEYVLRNDIRTYRPELVLHVKGISVRCGHIVKDTQAATAVKQGNNQKKSLVKNVTWCFQKRSRKKSPYKP